MLRAGLGGTAAVCRGGALELLRATGVRRSISSEGEMDGEERGEIMGVPSLERFGDRVRSMYGESTAACLLIRN